MQALHLQRGGASPHASQSPAPNSSRVAFRLRLACSLMLCTSPCRVTVIPTVDRVLDSCETRESCAFVAWSHSEACRRPRPSDPVLLQQRDEQMIRHRATTCSSLSGGRWMCLIRPGAGASGRPLLSSLSSTTARRFTIDLARSRCPCCASCRRDRDHGLASFRRIISSTPPNIKLREQRLQTRPCPHSPDARFARGFALPGAMYRDGRRSPLQTAEPTDSPNEGVGGHVRMWLVIDARYTSSARALNSAQLDLVEQMDGLVDDRPASLGLKPSAECRRPRQRNRTRFQRAVVVSADANKLGAISSTWAERREKRGHACTVRVLLWAEFQPVLRCWLAEPSRRPAVRRARLAGRTHQHAS